MKFLPRFSFLASSVLLILLSLGLHASPAHAQGSASERIFFNARIFTSDPQSPYAEAIAIRGDNSYL